MAKRKQTEVVDLEMDGNGEYVSKHTLNIEKVKPLRGIAKRNEVKPKKQKPIRHNPEISDTFLGGVDLGMDFIEKIVPRVERFLKLRG